MQSIAVARVALVSVVLAACGGGGSEGDAAGTDSSSGSTSTNGQQPTTVDPPTTNPDPSNPSTPSGTDDPTAATDDPSDTTDTPADTTEASADETVGTGHGECDFTENFDGVADGSPWPDYWTSVGGVEIADVQGGRGRLVPSPGPYALARLVTPLDCSDIDVSFSLEMSQPGVQGVGLYVRQNGGYLQQTNPTGEGYVAFIQGFMNPAGIGIWREVDGAEQLIDGNVAATIMPGVTYRARLRVTQQDASTTLLQAKVWPESGTEPDAWQVERQDSHEPLQGAGGSLAVDTYTVQMQNVGTDMFIDDIVATAAR